MFCLFMFNRNIVDFPLPFQPVFHSLCTIQLLHFFFQWWNSKKEQEYLWRGNFSPKIYIFRKNSFSLVLGLLSNVSSGAPAYKTFQSSNTFCRNPKKLVERRVGLTKRFQNRLKIPQKWANPPPNPAQFWKACFLSKSLKLLKFLLLFQRQNQGNEEV